MQPRDLFISSRIWHSKPLAWLTVASVFSALVLIPLWIFDERTLGGVPVWEKPIKFFISSAIFGITYSWLSSFIEKGSRWVRIAGSVIALSLAIELVLITAVAGFGETSHFNVSSPLAITIWSLMATFISLVLIATLFLSFLIIRDRSQVAGVRLGLGLGSFNTAVGMGLAFLMTSPTANQLANFQGIAGAHSVGTSDGGPGLPFLGWSTVAGDLRVGHFFGLHSIQVAIALLVLAFLLPVALRLPALIVGNFTYLGFVGIVTWQALRAEPFSSPSNLTITSLVILLACAVLVLGFLNLINLRSKSRNLA
ncbi:MAG: hypothetical protein RIS08_105 [Actinomycetota bacterium]|jgi:hypothetical protein